MTEIFKPDQIKPELSAWLDTRRHFIRKATIQVTCENVLLQPVFMLVVRWRPVVDVALITRAKEEVRRSTVGRRSGNDDWWSGRWRWVILTKLVKQVRSKCVLNWSWISNTVILARSVGVKGRWLVSYSHLVAFFIHILSNWSNVRNVVIVSQTTVFSLTWQHLTGTPVAGSLQRRVGNGSMCLWEPMAADIVMVSGCVAWTNSLLVCLCWIEDSIMARATQQNQSCSVINKHNKCPPSSDCFILFSPPSVSHTLPSSSSLSISLSLCARGRPTQQPRSVTLLCEITEKGPTRLLHSHVPRELWIRLFICLFIYFS